MQRRMEKREEEGEGARHHSSCSSASAVLDHSTVPHAVPLYRCTVHPSGAEQSC